jgi:hypothetical protein
MKNLRCAVRLAIALILAVVIPACHHNARKSPPPADQQDPSAPKNP